MKKITVFFKCALLKAKVKALSFVDGSDISYEIMLFRIIYQIEMAFINIRYPNGHPENSRKPDIRILDGPNITANLYCICLSVHKHTLTQMQYRFAVTYETPSTFIFRQNSSERTKIGTVTSFKANNFH